MEKGAEVASYGAAEKFGIETNDGQRAGTRDWFPGTEFDGRMPDPVPAV
jgi:hypothetical protein